MSTTQMCTTVVDYSRVEKMREKSYVTCTVQCKYI